MSLDMIPTHYPLEDILEAHENDDDKVSFCLLPDNPLVPHRCDELTFLDSTDIETDALAYDIEQDESPHKTDRTTFVHTDSHESLFALMQPSEKVRKTWYNHLEKLETKVDPFYALDQPCYSFQSSLLSLEPSIIQATYISSPYQDVSHTPHFPLKPQLTVDAQLPSGLPIQILIDTGCRKTILNRNFLQNMLHILLIFIKFLYRKKTR